MAEVVVVEPLGGLITLEISQYNQISLQRLLQGDALRIQL